MVGTAVNVGSIGYAVINQIQIFRFIGLMLGVNKAKIFNINIFQISHIINCLYN